MLALGLCFRALLLVLELLQVPRGCDEREAARDQVIACETGLHIDDCAHLAEVFDILAQDQFHILHCSLLMSRGSALLAVSPGYRAMYRSVRRDMSPQGPTGKGQQTKSHRSRYRLGPVQRRSLRIRQVHEARTAS